MKEILQRISDLEAAVQQLQQHQPTTAPRPVSASRLLLELGIPDSLKGHGYLLEAIALSVREPSIKYAVCTELYPQVAKAAGTTASKAERCMRNAIEVAFDRADLNVLYRYFGNTVSREKGKPTVSEFVARCAAILRDEA